MDNVTNQLDDILPSYIEYVKIKRKYQLNELTSSIFIYATGLQRNKRVSSYII